MSVAGALPMAPGDWPLRWPLGSAFGGPLGLLAGHSYRAVAIVAAVWLVAVAALTLLMRARPAAFPLLAVFALPFRVPIPTEGRTVDLLIPLYAVVAAGCLAHLLPRLAPRLALSLPVDRWLSARLPGGAAAGEGSRANATDGSVAYASGRPLMALDWLLGAYVALYALQIAYSADPGKGAQNLVFFYVPFGLLYVLLREAPWTRRLVLGCFAVAVGLAIVFSGIGFVEYARKELLLNPRVVAANRFDKYFRVNSLFFDPNIYGRFLVLVMLAVTAAVLRARSRREVLIGAAVLAWLWGGLIMSFSQSSIVALLVGLAVLAALRWGVWRTAAVAGVLAVLGVAALLAAPASLHLGLKGVEGSANNATSGRASLVKGGLRLFGDRPLQGFGSGSFETEYKRHEKVTVAGAASASHTIPITVAAEQGVLGLALYGALLLAAFALLLTGVGGRALPGAGRGSSAERAPPQASTSLRAGVAGWLGASADRAPPASTEFLRYAVRPALAACFAALVVHTLAYADFLEDPFTWTLLAAGVALLPISGKTAPHAALSRTAHAPSGQPAHAPVGTASESG